MKKLICLLFVIGVLIIAAWLVFVRFERVPPVVDITLPSTYLNLSCEMNVRAEDGQTGLRRVRVTIMQPGIERILLEKEYHFDGFAGYLKGGEIKHDSFTIPVDVQKYGMTEGDAIIKVAVSDFSWRGWGKGNIYEAEESVRIDTTPPRVEILSTRHNLERGGSGLVIYRLFEENLQSGVQVGEDFFPGYIGMFDDQNVYASFFALSHEQGPGTQMMVTVKDPAGNKIQRGFYHYIRDHRFKSDVLNISDRFLDSKMPDFNVVPEGSATQMAGGHPMLDKFVYINKVMRKKNSETLLKVPSVSEPEMFWSGRFLRMNNSAQRAGFGDRRTYRYKGQEIGKSIHLGIDLASVAAAPVEAANAGKIIFADNEGIYGNTVIIDHGFGLCSLYSHLSRISVNLGDMVDRGSTIGTSGTTGLAGGDHLHFSMIVHHVFVNPVEWWDGTWIKNNITNKIEEVRRGL